MISRRGSTSTGDDDVARFSRLAEQWWDAQGPWATLHKFNAVRVGYIRDRVAAYFGRDPVRPDCLAELRVIDVGCGGGLLSEPLARLGAAVTGIDPSESSIAVARRHAAQSGLDIDYRCTTVDALVSAAATFDVVLAMEVVEHVANAPLFIESAAALAKPGGLVFVGTLNRTAKSFVLAIVGAEYVLRWIPRGTHRWGKFVTPNELETALARSGLRVTDRSGVTYNPLAGRFRLCRNLGASYMVAAQKTL